ncbi:transcriptional regulator NrdR [Patescibacteria group bacterium]
MLCPVCEKGESKVVDSREVDDGKAIRRRRECLGCKARFSTYEQLELLELNVIKRDNRIEPYDLEKIERGLKHSLSKRPITENEVKQILGDVEREIVKEALECKIKSGKIGEIILRILKSWDEVAYIRFASVHRSFDSIETFAQEIKKLQ